MIYVIDMTVLTIISLYTACPIYHHSFQTIAFVVIQSVINFTKKTAFLYKLGSGSHFAPRQFLVGMHSALIALVSLLCDQLQKE